MDAVFTLPYPELIVGDFLARAFPKSEGYSVTMPLSRQQKGFDLLLYRKQSRKAVSIQVKSSRSYLQDQPKRATTARFNYGLWFRRFRLETGAADFYILFGLYPRADVVDRSLRRPRKPKTWWHHRLLLFSDSEMQNLLRQAAKDSFLGFGFDHGDEAIYLTRGAGRHLDYTGNAFAARAPAIAEFLR